MVCRFAIDKHNGKIFINAGGYKGISEELSSEDELTQEVVSYILHYSYGKPMWYSTDCVVDATATCDKEDEFNEKTGKTICESKAALKYHQKMYDRYLKVAWLLKKISDRMMKFVELHQKKIERLEKDLEQFNN